MRRECNLKTHNALNRANVVSKLITYFSVVEMENNRKNMRPKIACVDASLRMSCKKIKISAEMMKNDESYSSVATRARKVSAYPYMNQNLL